MADLEDLAKWCNELPDRIEKAASVLAVEVTKAMATDLIAHTPVDITTAVSNWQVSLNEPPFVGFDAIFPGVRGSTAPQSREAAYAHIVRVLALKTPGNVIYLSNLTPYIIDLNNGSSKQAPAGFVERGILVGEQYGARTGLVIR